jgi:FkbM family methyltransferase
MKKYVVTYAQNREDIILDGFFRDRKKGFYVDVGAGSPNVDSVTRIFYEKGWSGINIDPIERIHKDLNKVRPRDINLNLGVSNKEDVLKFREYICDGFSTFAENIKNEYIKHADKNTDEYRDYEVKTMRLADILATQKVKEIQFLKVDVEGYEYEVLEGNDWKKFRPEVICIEANHVKKDWRKLLRDNGYTLTFFDGLNEYYTDDRTKVAKNFSYIDAVIYREPIVNYHLLEDIAGYERQIAELASELHRHQEHIGHVEYALDQAKNELEEIRPLAGHLKRLARQKIAVLKSHSKGNK